MADHNPLTSFSRFIALLLFPLFMVTGLAAGVSVGFDQPGITVMPGEITTVNLTLDAAPAGISGFAIGISVEDPSIGEITEVTLPGWAELSDIAGVPGPEVSIMAADLQEKVEKGASGILLATLSVKGLSSGTTEILLQEPIFDDDDGNEMAPVLSGVSVTVAADGSTPPATTTGITTTTTGTAIATPTTSATATTSGSVYTAVSGDGGSGGGSSAVSAPVVTTASGTPGPETSPTLEQTSEQTAETLPAMTSPSVPSIPTGETTSPSPAGQGIPFLSAPGVTVLVCALVLLGKKLR